MAKRRAPSASGTPAGPGVGERILNTASNLFYKEGVRAVGIQRLIEEAGIAKASLYAHYHSKDELVAACIDKQACAAQAWLEAKLHDAGLDARGKLLRLFDAHVECVGSADFRGCPLQNAVSEIVDASHPAKAVTAKHRRWLRDLLTGLTKEAGIEPSEEVAGALLVLYDGASASAQVDGTPAPARHARWAAEHILDTHLSRRLGRRREVAQQRRNAGRTRP